MLGLAALALALAEGPCPNVPGVGALLTPTVPPIIIIGEVHGTHEAPSRFADVVCHAALERPVIVALEFEEDAQPALDAWMGSDGSLEATRALLTQRHWQERPQGLSSVAMLELLRRLRVMRAKGADLRVIAVRPVDATGRSVDQGMAAALLGARAAAPAARVFVLTGNGHARRSGLGSPLSLADHLPPPVALSLNVEAGGGGDAWNCNSDRCGVHPYEDNDYPAGVVLGEGLAAGFDGVLRLGVRTTAAPPVRLDPGQP